MFIKTLCPTVLTLATAALLTESAGAAVIDFQQNPPYVPGSSISGKADPNAGNTWAGGLAATVGFDAPLASATEFWYLTPATAQAGNNRIGFTDEALGGPGVSSGTFAYGFDLRRASPGASNNSANTGFARVNTVRFANGGGGSPVRIDLLQNGLVGFFNGGSQQFVTLDGQPSASTGSRFDIDSGAFDNNFVRLEGVINFDNDTFTLAVDGVEQNGGNPIAFNGAAARAATDPVGQFLV